MKHLKPFNENKDNTEELQDLCDSYFAYLYDEGFEIQIEGQESSGYVIKIVKPTVERNFSINPLCLWGNQTFTWDEIKDYFIPFTQQLLKNHDLNPNPFASTGITFKYIKPKYIHHAKANAPWYEHPSTLNAGVFFRPTPQQIINDEILDEPSTIYSTAKCMNYIYEINILLKP